MNKAREHASLCTVVPTLDPMEAIFLSILVEQEKELLHLNNSLSNKESISNYFERFITLQEI